MRGRGLSVAPRLCVSQNYDAEWALSSAFKGALLDREVYRMRSLGAAKAQKTGKRQYIKCARVPCCAV